MYYKMELFTLTATEIQWATTLLEVIMLRYSLIRLKISGNRSLIVSTVTQHLCFLLGIEQSLTPMHHPQANSVLRKNGDLKSGPSIFVGNDDTSWEEKLPLIHCVMNAANCEITGVTSSFLQFARELRTTNDVKHDIREVIRNNNFVPEITL